MRAVIVQRKSQLALSIEEVGDPRQGESEACVGYRTHRYQSRRDQRRVGSVDGARIGSDFSGTVIVAAPSGSGLRTGVGVVGAMPQGGWPERFASPVSTLAEVPDDLELETAGCLPVPATAPSPFCE